MRARQLGLELAARSSRDAGGKRSRAERAAEACAVAAIKRALREPSATKAHGGRRAGAGRKPAGGRARRPHGIRPFLSVRHPVHVVLRVTPEVGRLRRRTAHQAFQRALATSLWRADFRVVHVSIQAEHVHLICEASDRLALSRGVRGLCISAAQHLNTAIGRDRGQPRRRGRVFTDRYHATPITNARQSRSTLAYVLNNWRHHDEDRTDPALRRARIDPYSSGLWFAGWQGREGSLWQWPSGHTNLPTRPARTWLLTTGWRRWGPISLDERP